MHIARRIGIALLPILLLTSWIVLPQREEVLDVYFFDIDQGDSALLISPSGKQIVIDGGPNTALLEHLGAHMPFFDRTIELVVLSHPHSDHITALLPLLDRYTVQAILMSGAEYNLARYEGFLAKIEQYGIPVIKADPDHDIDMEDGLTLDVIWPREEDFGRTWENVNNASVAFRAIFCENSLFFGGDIEEEAESQILRSGQNIQANILKSSHHGSRSSSTEAFLAAIDPKAVIISSGKENKFAHPHSETLQKYKNLDLSVYNTAIHGTVHFRLPKKPTESQEFGIIEP